MSGLRDLSWDQPSVSARKIPSLSTYFRTSIPASPNLSAAYPNMGSIMRTRNGVQILHLNGAPAFAATIVASTAYNTYNTGVTPRATRIFQVARTSRPAILTSEAARASADGKGHEHEPHVQKLRRTRLPLAFLREMIEAVMKMGPFKITPGNARIVQTVRRPKRYVRRPNVFQPAF